MPFPLPNWNGQVQDHWGSVKGGSDLFAPRGTPIMAMSGGKVIESGWNSVGGNSVLIQGDDGLQYYYAHMNTSPYVTVGQRVPPGANIGQVGNTGDANKGDPHLHIGIGPDIKLGADKYGGTGGDFDAVSLLRSAQAGGTVNAGRTIAPNNGRVQPGFSVDPNDVNSISDYIRQSAQARGIDPEIAVRVAQSEGLNTYVGDSNSSFGPFQLHYGNVAGGGNAVGGLGDAFTKATGLDARNPDTIAAQVDFALDQAATNGWGPWHGAARAGVGNFTGIGSTSKALGQYSPANGSGTNVSPQGPTRPANIPDWVPQDMWNMYSNNAYANPYAKYNPGSFPAIPNLGTSTGGFQNMPYTPGSPTTYSTMPFYPSQNTAPIMTPMSSFSPYSAPQAQPNIMSLMSRPGSLYG